MSSFATVSTALLLVVGLNASVFAADTKDYQVTGQVLEVTPTMIAVQKGAERWEINRGSTKGTFSEVKVGDRVTVHYIMTATKLEGLSGSKEKDPKNTKFGAQKKE